MALEFLIEADDGSILDACVELDAEAITLQSRGGTKGAAGARNQDYSKALRLILARVHASRRSITGSWVDSSRVQSLPLSERLIFLADDGAAGPEELFSLLGRRMEAVGQAPSADPSKGNRSKRIRIQLDGGSIGEIASTIEARPKSAVPRSALRLPEADLGLVTASHVWDAVQELLAGAKHDFGESSDFDLCTEGQRLPPKAVFGIAATSALGFPVQPVHFLAGFGKPAFDTLVAAGFPILPKGVEPLEQGEFPVSQDDREWAEGYPRLRRHLARERSRGLTAAKRAQFLGQNGKLFCERCKMDPTEVYGDPDGAACIEVHHAEKQVSHMEDGHNTKLSDLECLCANCHRYVHRLLKRAIQSEAQKANQPGEKFSSSSTSA